MSHIIKDEIQTSDKLLRMQCPSSTLTRTQIIGGFDPYIDDKGVTQFGEVLFDEENMIVLGGSLFTLEKLIGQRADNNLNVYQLKEFFTGVPSPVDGAGNPAVPATVSTAPLAADNTICLFGVGIGGAGDSISDINDVHYYERGIVDMIPFRQVGDDSELTSSEHSKYFYRSADTQSGLISYYLKKISSKTIQSRWRDSDNEGEGSSVSRDVYNTSSSVTTPIDTYMELTLEISLSDIREYFENNNNVELARVNSIALFTGIPHTMTVPINVEYDVVGQTPITRTIEYDEIKMFSKLNINNDMFDLPKDLTILYRIFAK